MAQIQGSLGSPVLSTSSATPLCPIPLPEHLARCCQGTSLGLALPRGDKGAPKSPTLTMSPTERVVTLQHMAAKWLR